MTTRASSDLDKELSEVLLSISTVSKRIADRLNAYGNKRLEGENSHGKSKRVISTYR